MGERVPGPTTDRLASIATIREELGLDVVDAFESVRGTCLRAVSIGRRRCPVVCASVPPEKAPTAHVRRRRRPVRFLSRYKSRDGRRFADKAPELARCTMRHAANVRHVLVAALCVRRAVRRAGRMLAQISGGGAPFRVDADDGVGATHSYVITARHLRSGASTLVRWIVLYKAALPCVISLVMNRRNIISR